MKTFVSRIFVPCLALTSTVVKSATEQSDKMAPEPTVNVIWVGVFLLFFVAVCVWGGVVFYRAHRKSKVVGRKD